MAGLLIRLYKNSDYEVVRELFNRGMMEHYPVTFRLAVGHPRCWLSILVMTLASFWITEAIPVPILVAIVPLGILWYCSIYIYSAYVDQCLREDMLDIQKYYMQRDCFCFWVAESKGEVVGTVAAIPSPYPNEQDCTEMKRLTVAKSHRRRGIAKALCRTVMDFAQRIGSKAVVLETALSQTDAQKLYERLGFYQTRHIHQSYFVGRILGFVELFYRYDITGNE